MLDLMVSMVSNKDQAEKFVQACMYPPTGYRVLDQ